LLIGQRTADAFLNLGDRLGDGVRGGDRGVVTFETGGEPLGDHLLPGDHRRQRMDRFDRPGHPDQRDDHGVGEDPGGDGIDQVRRETCTFGP
jgi:hypothetical protein